MTNICAPSLVSLIDKLNDNYFITIKDIYIPEGDIIGFSYSRLENKDEIVPSDKELAEFKEGKINLYCVEYYFSIEKRNVCQVNIEDFNTEGIKYER